ncbi:hypothetical protein BSKO_03754 [Bryopsis sp. KO-2023]|nr:hypothetical protein BSKO_03754 [Bryopsis sp. KO-2023]
MASQLLGRCLHSAGVSGRDHSAAFSHQRRLRGVDRSGILRRSSRRCERQRVRSRRKDSPIVPPVIPLGNEGEAQDLYSYLLQNRIVFLGSFVDFETSTKIVGSLLALEADNEDEDIKMYINSFGGSIYAILGIVDVMLSIKPKISTVVFGMSGSNASLILAAGEKGRRFAMPNSRIILQQPAGYLRGSAAECSITAKELNRSLKAVNSFFSKFTGRTLEEMEMETNRENYLSPEKAIDLGIIDGVV